MENMKEAKQRVMEILRDMEKREEELSQEIEKAEEEKAKAIQAKKKYMESGEMAKVAKHKTEADAYAERINYLQQELENISAENLKEEIEELQDFARKYANRKIRKTADVYYKAWIEGKQSEDEAEKAISSANWIINETDKILKRRTVNRIFPSHFAGMIEQTQNDFKYIDAWNCFYKRRREEYLK